MGWLVVHGGHAHIIKCEVLSYSHGHGRATLPKIATQARYKETTLNPLHASAIEN